MLLRALWLALGVLALLLVTASAKPAPAPTVGLTERQRTALVRLVHDDAEARALFEPLQEEAQAALTATPDPIERIQTEGKLASDPVKIRTQQSLRDMGTLNALGWTAAVMAGGKPIRADNPYAVQAKRFILAWADVNQPTGDPIDETNLEPLIVAYDLTRIAFTPDERGRVDAWLRRVAAEELRTGQRKVTTSMNNWNSHRLKIIGLIGYALGDSALIGDAIDGFRRQIEINLEADGSSFDFHDRDALHYHCYDLEPLLALAIAARQAGTDLYHYRAPSGASLEKSVAFLVPFADGTKTHPEFVNSHVSFDRKRAATGDKTYQAGRPFDPHQALKALSLAAFFDPAYGALERRVSGSAAARFVSWQDVLDAARRADSPGTMSP